MIIKNLKILLETGALVAALCVILLAVVGCGGQIDQNNLKNYEIKERQTANGETRYVVGYEHPSDMLGFINWQGDVFSEQFNAEERLKEYREGKR